MILWPVKMVVAGTSVYTLFFLRLAAFLSEAAFQCVFAAKVTAFLKIFRLFPFPPPPNSSERWSWRRNTLQMTLLYMSGW